MTSGCHYMPYIWAEKSAKKCTGMYGPYIRVVCTGLKLTNLEQPNGCAYHFLVKPQAADAGVRVGGLPKVWLVQIRPTSNHIP